MKYDMTRPCDQCPFLMRFANGFTVEQLEGFASGEFPCHKTADLNETDQGHGDFVATDDSNHCAGALIYLERRGRSHQMMRICERLGMYDRMKLDMSSDVR